MRATLISLLDALLEERELPKVTWADETPLYGEGSPGFDSLDMAVLSSQLEAALGKDPFSQGQFLRTFGALVRFYEGP